MLFFLLLFPESLREDLISMSVTEAVKQLTSHSDEKVKDAAVAVITKLESTSNIER